MPCWAGTVPESALELGPRAGMVRNMNPGWILCSMGRRLLIASLGVGWAALAQDFPQVNVRPTPVPAGVELRLSGKAWYSAGG